MVRLLRRVLLALIWLTPLAGQSAELSENLTGSARFVALTEAAQDYQSRGFKRKALPYLYEAEELASNLGQPEQQQVALMLGALLYDVGVYTEAQSVLQNLLQDAAEGSLMQARTLNELGMVLSLANDHDQALARLGEGIELAEQHGHKILHAKLLTNQAKVLLASGKVPEFESGLKALAAVVKQLPDVDIKAQLLISSADLYRSGYWYFDLDKSWFAEALANLKLAEQIAQQQDDSRLLSYAMGYQARLYEDDKIYETAIALSRQAAFHASAVSAYESAYLWQWQIGRIHNRGGDTEAAIASYQQAIETLEHVRQDLIDGSPYTFHEKVLPVFTELSDILLTSASAVTSHSNRQAQLTYVQEILEQAKSAELQDYFQNDCVLPEESVQLDEVEVGTATIYPVILPNRLELLVSIAGDIHQFQSEIDVNELNFLVNEFRDHLQVNLGDDEYLEIGEELYELVIAPFEDLLADKNVETLLFVPDGSLRTIPISALYDGDEFLIEKYAIATTPGLKLTLPQPLSLSSATVFAGGISDAVQGFSALPGVPVELENLKSRYGAEVLSNEAFSTDVVSQEMASADYSIVHIATHGHFDSNPQKSFLLAHDDKLTMNMLEQSIGFRKYLGDPLELLVLSACETAAGDNRAALGLAGVALKAGARSAVATLWQISDAATVRLIDSFYDGTASGDISKAKALQRAQITLLQDDGFYHPSDWAPFLLIGNWL